MRISDILDEGMVFASLSAPGKESALEQLAGHLTTHPEVAMPADLIHSALLGRERLGSTGVGEGVAIPHAKIPGLERLIACFARSPDGIPFDSIDQRDAKLIFVLLVPENSAGAHLKALARISRLLRDASFRDGLLELPDAAALRSAFLLEDSKY